MTDSYQLIVDYSQKGSEAAFRELVARYLGLVHSTALRFVGGDTHLAQDVSQTVFTDLARMARTLSPEVMVGGWLHRHTCFVAAKMMRGERRRHFRERQAVEMKTLEESSAVSISQLGPVLDDAINELPEPDRTAILLRFFEQDDFGRIGERIGSSEDAARMRVNRALEKLQLLLKRQGITSTAAGLAVTLSANAVQTAPLGLAAHICTAALPVNTMTTMAAAAATKGIAMTTLQMHRHTCFVAAKMMRGERRRHFRERQAVEMNTLEESSAVSMSQLGPVLDDAINELPEPDRTAILLRFFEQDDFGRIGERIGSSEDAARMRVNRALEKLQLLLKRQGITSTAAGLAVTLSANAVQTAPLGLAAHICTAALPVNAMTTMASAAATKGIAMTTLQKGMLAAAFVTVVGAGVYEARQASRLRADVETLQRQQAPLTQQLQDLEQERDAASNRLALVAAENKNLSGGEHELLRLRGEVGTLHAQVGELTRLRQENQNLQAQISDANANQMLEDKVTENLTADGTNLLMSLQVSWRVSDAKTFGLRFADVSAPALQRQLESMVSYAKAAVVGQHKASDLVSSAPSEPKRSQIENEIQNAIATQLARTNLGISVESVSISTLAIAGGARSGT